jgi:hypothetical protein
VESEPSVTPKTGPSEIGLASTAIAKAATSKIENMLIESIGTEGC